MEPIDIKKLHCSAGVFVKKVPLLHWSIFKKFALLHQGLCKKKVSLLCQSILKKIALLHQSCQNKKNCTALLGSL